MIHKTLVVLLILSSIASAAVDKRDMLEQAFDDSPKVSSPVVGRHFPIEFWGILDWTVGLILGAYGPILKMTRDEDCFSAFYKFGVEAVSYSGFFSKQFDINDFGSWMGLSMKFLFHSFLATFTVVRTCISELEQNRDIPWHLNFGFLENDIEIPLIKNLKEHPFVQKLFRDNIIKEDIGTDIGYIW